jgi:hypothetical protein
MDRKNELSNAEKASHYDKNSVFLWDLFRQVKL